MKRVLKYLAYFVCLVLIVVAAAVAYVFYASNQRIAVTYAVTPPALEITATTRPRSSAGGIWSTRCRCASSVTARTSAASR